MDRASWASLATQSSLTVPIFSGGTVNHVIAIATVSEERDWPVEYVPRLRVLGEMMATALLRAQTFESLRTAHDELKRLRDRLERENVYLREEVASGTGSDLVEGSSPAIRRVPGTGRAGGAYDLHGAPPRRNGNG